MRSGAEPLRARVYFRLHSGSCAHRDVVRRPPFCRSPPAVRGGSQFPGYSCRFPGERMCLCLVDEASWPPGSVRLDQVSGPPSEDRCRFLYLCPEPVPKDSSPSPGLQLAGGGDVLVSG
mmetsp:Transcript_54340/g.145035  ORF Transcript_54340/g.145035 Transcript_54340/m.145035 type:complete len:119 (+) Transcript_54340:1227-1583(+)